MSTWMVVNAGADEIEDLCQATFHVFETHLPRPTDGQIRDAVAALLGPSNREMGDVLREARVYLIPLREMEDLGTLRGSISYRQVAARVSPGKENE